MTISIDEIKEQIGQQIIAANTNRGEAKTHLDSGDSELDEASLEAIYVHNTGRITGLDDLLRWIQRKELK